MKKDHLTYDLISAVISDDEERTHLLLTEGANPNHSLDKANVTPLHHAAQHNSLKTMSLLLNAGADVNARTHPDDQTPLEIALLHHFRQAAQLLSYYMQSTAIPETAH